MVVCVGPPSPCRPPPPPSPPPPLVPHDDFHMKQQELSSIIANAELVAASTCMWFNASHPVGSPRPANPTPCSLDLSPSPRTSHLVSPVRACRNPPTGRRLLWSDEGTIDSVSLHTADFLKRYSHSPVVSRRRRHKGDVMGEVLAAMSRRQTMWRFLVKWLCALVEARRSPSTPTAQDGMETKWRRAEEQLVSRENQLHALREELMVKDDELESLNTTLTAKDDESREAAEQLKAAMEMLEEARVDLHKLRSENSSLNAKAASAETRAKEAQEHARRATDSLEGMSERVRKAMEAQEAMAAEAAKAEAEQAAKYEERLRDAREENAARLLLLETEVGDWKMRAMLAEERLEGLLRDEAPPRPGPAMSPRRDEGGSAAPVPPAGGPFLEAVVAAKDATIKRLRDELRKAIDALEEAETAAASMRTTVRRGTAEGQRSSQDCVEGEASQAGGALAPEEGDAPQDDRAAGDTGKLAVATLPSNPTSEALGRSVRSGLSFVKSIFAG